MNQEPMLVLDENGTIVIANDAIVELLDRARSDLLGIHFFKLHDSISKNTDLQSDLQTAFHDNTDFSTKTFTLQTIDEEHLFMINGRVIKNEKNYPYRILLHFEKQK
jgi:two-component system CheB/CheR fusion protein